MVGKLADLPPAAAPVHLVLMYLVVVSDEIDVFPVPTRWIFYANQDFARRNEERTMWTKCAVFTPFSKLVVDLATRIWALHVCGPLA